MTLRVARAQAPFDRTAINFDAALIVVVLVVLFCTAALVWWRVGRELDVIDRIAARIEPDAILPIAGEISLEGVPAELRRFVESVNHSTLALGNALAHERRWSRDLAHELRTPIAELRTLLDVAISFPQVHDAHTVQVQARAIAIDMDTLVSSLLLMSRVESGMEQILLHTFDLHAELLLLTHKQTHWRLDVPAPFWVYTDARLLKIVLSNLVNNAIAYAVPADSVKIATIETQEGGVALAISNGAPALKAEDIAQMHKRFWRKSAKTDVSGRSGLGLSIVSALCEMLNLRLSLQLSAQQVLTVRIDGLQLGTTPENGTTEKEIAEKEIAEKEISEKEISENLTRTKARQ